MSGTIHIYHTNDIHSHFSSWPSIQAFLTERRRWHEDAGDVCLVLDIGDHVDRSHPFSEGTAGKGNVDLLNKAGYDAVTIGNNEGITLSKEELQDLYTQADFEVVLSNLLDETGAHPDWAEPYRIMTTEGGIRIGLVGATAEFTPFYKRLGWRVTDAKQSIIDTVGQINEQTDLIICLSHLGIKEDEQLAELCPDIDIILGAHTHHIFHEGKEIGKTMLGAAGKFGMYIGHITIDLSSNKKTARLIETAALKNADEHFNEKLSEQGKELLSEPVFYSNKKLQAEWFKESELSTIFGEALIEFADADCAMFNAGLFMENLPIGETTRYDFHKMLPHPINPCLVELTGAELKEIYSQSLNPEWPNIELKGMGFRGAVFGNMIRTGMSMEGHQLKVGSKIVSPTAIYRLITLDMFTFGFFFPALKRAPKTYYMPEFIRDVFSRYFRNKAME